MKSVILILVLMLLGCGRNEEGEFKKVCIYGISYFKYGSNEAPELKDDGTNVGCN